MNNVTEDLNAVANVPGALKADLVDRAARFGAAGWIAFAFTATALIVQNVVMAIMPDPVMAAENGKVIGQVIFDEAKIRANDEILGDVKSWVARCTSVNKLSIYEDLAICLNHMDQDLSEARLKDYEKRNYAVAIEKFGCERPSVDFDNTKTTVKRKTDLPYEINATVAGNVLCAVPGDKAASQAFVVELSARLTDKTTALPLGFQVSTFKDVEK